MARESDRINLVYIVLHKQATYYSKIIWPKEHGD